MERYINNKDPQNITNNLVIHNSNNSNNILFKKALSLKHYKQIYNILLVTLVIIAIKVALTYKFLISNFLYINILNKNIDVASLLSNNLFIFKLSYYLLFSFFTFNITSFFINKIILSKNNFSTNLKKDIGIIVGKDLNNQDVSISNNGIFQNILITGSIGSGKTSSAVSNILDQLISKNMSGLIIDIKGNYVETVEKICKKYNRCDKLKVLTLDNDFKYNPINKPNVSAYELANIITKAICLISKKNISDSFFMEKAESVIRDIIVLIRANKMDVSFAILHKMVINKEYLLSVIDSVKNNVIKNIYNDNELFNINCSIANIKNEYFNLDERTFSIIKSEITRATTIFTSDYDLFDKFCSVSEEINFLEDNNIIVISIGIGKNELLTKLISTYVKLDFQKQILSKINSFPIFFVCDEYQEIANSEDAHFFSISREYKCINVISMQSYSSLINALNDENSSKVIIQNLVNKIWFRNDDIYTVSEIIKHIGKERKERKTVNVNESSQHSKFSLIKNDFTNYKSGLSQGISYAENNEYMFSEEYFTRELQNFQAICMLNCDGNITLNKKVILKRWEEDIIEK